MTIKVIVELQAHPGRRAELLSTLVRLTAEHGPRMRGYLGGAYYEAIDHPDMLVEIAEWESVEARMALMSDSEAMGAFAPIFELLAEPFRATVIRPV